MGKPTRRERGLPPGKPSPPSLPPKLKQALVKAQIKRMEQLTEPLNIKYDISTLEGIKKLNADLTSLVLKRKLSSDELRAISDALQNQIKILMPQDLEERVKDVLQETEDLRTTVAGLQQQRADASASKDSSQRAAK